MREERIDQLPGWDQPYKKATVNNMVIMSRNVSDKLFEDFMFPKVVVFFCYLKFGYKIHEDKQRHLQSPHPAQGSKGSLVSNIQPDSIRNSML